MGLGQVGTKVTVSRKEPGATCGSVLAQVLRRDGCRGPLGPHGPLGSSAGSTWGSSPALESDWLHWARNPPLLGAAYPHWHMSQRPSAYVQGRLWLPLQRAALLR